MFHLLFIYKLVFDRIGIIGEDSIDRNKISVLTSISVGLLYPQRIIRPGGVVSQTVHSLC